MRSGYHHHPGGRRRRRNPVARSEGGEGSHCSMWGRRGQAAIGCVFVCVGKKSRVKWRLDTLQGGTRGRGFPQAREGTAIFLPPSGWQMPGWGSLHSLSWGALGTPGSSPPWGDALGGRVRVGVAREGCGQALQSLTPPHPPPQVSLLQPLACEEEEEEKLQEAKKKQVFFSP